MALTREYERKVDLFLKNLPKREYKRIGCVEFEGFLTYDRLKPDDAKAHKREPLKEGFECGRKWEYIWMFATVTVPAEYEGQTIIFKADYKEGLIFVNGKVHGSIDRCHREITLTRNARENEIFEIAMEIYAGHDGPRPKYFGAHSITLIPGEDNEEFGEDINQVVIKNGEFGIFNEEVYAFETDLCVINNLYKTIADRDSLRVASLSKGLKSVCNAVNIEAEDDEFLPMVEKAREILKPLLECKNGSTVPVIHAVAHSHLDLEWLWTRNETIRKTARTMGNQLRLIEQFPESRYLQSQAWILNNIKNEYPDLYKEVQKAIAKGKVIPDGGMWVESDINMPSGESLIRQFLFGKRFFAEEFGITSELFWLPDSFGMTAALPQIMKKCGIKYFINCKLMWLYNGGEKIPHSNFMWRGIDGSEVLTHLCSGYEDNVLPESVNGKWHDHAEKEDIPSTLLIYGYGDGGGGAVRTHHEIIRRERDLEGMPKVIDSTPQKFMEALDEVYDNRKTYVGELYYASHRGTYTSQAKTKNLNRRNEFALREAEMWSALLGADTKHKTDELWKEVLFDQFHDTLPGSSITRVYEIVEKNLTETLEKANRITDSALDNAVKPDSMSLTVVNSLSWDRSTIIALPDGYTSLCDNDGNKADTQRIGDTVYAEVTAPSCGFKCYRPGKSDVVCSSHTANEPILENDLITARFNDKGELISVYDKQSGMEFLSDVSNRFRIYQDLPSVCDAWDVDSFYESVEVQTDNNDAVIEECVSGELISYITFTKTVHNSRLRQRAVLEKDSKEIRFETEIDWDESHKLLKVDFNTSINTENLISEIQHGYCSRPNHKSRPYDADRFEVCQHKWSALAEQKRGAAILNDSKYGISAEGGRMSLTLLKSAEEPSRRADKGVQKFTYSFLPFTESLFDSDVVSSAYELNRPVIVKQGKAKEASMLKVDKKNIIIDTVKIAEDAMDDIVIRMYECKNSRTHCRLDVGFDIKKAYITNMIEQDGREIKVVDNSLELDFGAFEVITLKLVK